MKKLLTTALILTIAATCTALKAQPDRDEYLGLPGDNLNLYAVMKLFQESKTLEAFERTLNDENSRINNLDLNGDNFIDYIKVVDYVDGNNHNIVLRVAVNKYENQDVAVFTVQRFRDGEVQVQLIGDEALYGKNYIIEPYYDNYYAGGTPNPGYSGGNATVVNTTRIEIGAWPIVRFIFAPGYIAWHSSWYWGYWPTYWHPWRPCYWDYYYGYHYNWYHDYYKYYHRSDHYRYDHWNNFYTSNRREYSPIVNHRINSGLYKTTYSHPEQRRDGENLYARTNHDQNRRLDQSHRTDNNGNQTYKPAERRSYEGTSQGTTRRSNEAVTNRSVERRDDHNISTERRQAPAGNGNQMHTRSVTNDPGTARRSTANTNTRTISREMTANSSAPERRSSGSMTTRSAARPERTISADRPGNGGRSAQVSNTTPSRRSEAKSQPAKSQNRKSADDSKDSHRR
jgi:hypothetical protein